MKLSLERKARWKKCPSKRGSLDFVRHQQIEADYQGFLVRVAGFLARVAKVHSSIHPGIKFKMEEHIKIIYI